MGTLLGGATSGLQTAQDYIGGLRAAQDHDRELQSSASTSPISPVVESLPTSPIQSGKEHGLVDRGVKMGERRDGVPVDESLAVQGETRDPSRSWYSWIPGLGR